MLTPLAPHDWEAFLQRIVDDGVAAARFDYADDVEKANGAVAGFEACLGRGVDQLAALLSEARLDARQAFRERARDYWYWRCREAEIEWVCNVVSAALAACALPVLVPPTYRGLQKALEILGADT